MTVLLFLNIDIFLSINYLSAKNFIYFELITMNNKSTICIFTYLKKQIKMLR